MPDPAEQFANPYLAMGNNPVVYVDPDGEWIFIAVGALLGAYIGGSTANGGEFNPGKWAWDSGDTWAGILIGGGLGALGGWGATHAGPALANTGLFANFSASGTTAAYTLTGGVAGGAVGYTSGFAGGMLHSNGDWGYGHQSGVFGAQVGSAIGSAIGAGYGLVKGIDSSMPEYEEPPRVEWNKPLAATVSSDPNFIGSSEAGILNNNSTSTIFYKPDDRTYSYSDWGAYPLGAGNSTQTRVDAINVQGNVYKARDGYYSITVTRQNKILFDYPWYTPAYNRLYKIGPEWLHNFEQNNPYIEWPLGSGNYIENNQWYNIFNPHNQIPDPR